MCATTSDELYKEFYQSRKHLLKQKDKFEIDLRQFRQQIDEEQQGTS
jgi:hypothetical protein